MSAIAGIVSDHPADDLKRIIDDMCNIQGHRGPHGKSVKAIDGACLGHNLLLLSSEEENDPHEQIATLDNRLAIVYDGVLFNSTALTRELTSNGRATTPEPDCKIVLRSYLRWGKECAVHLDGIFSFAIWDSRSKQLYAARDRLGEKPFYYYMGSEGEFIFASEIKALLKSGRVSRDLDYEAIFQYLHEKGFVQQRTPISSVKALLPGYWLLWRDGSVSSHEYWDIPHSIEKITEPETVLSTSGDLLRDAVEKRTAKGDKIGVFYSGGIDSSLILGVIDIISEKPVKTFTIVTSLHEEQLDLSRKTALQFKTDHTEIHITPRSISDNLSDLVWYLSTPTAGSIMTYFCAQEARKSGVNLSFTGHAADTLLGISWLYRNVIPMERLMAPLRLIPEKARTGIYELGERILRGNVVKRGEGIKKYLLVLYLYLRSKRGLSRWYDTGLFPDQISKMFNPDISQKNWVHPADIYRGFFRKSRSKYMDEKSGYASLKIFLCNAAMNYESIAAAYSMQMHTPFLDQQLIEFSRRIPYYIKGKDDSDKYIPRELCRKLVSPECAGQKKGIFAPPIEEWLRSELWPIAEETLSKESIDRRGIFDHAKVAELLGQFKNRAPNISFADIWAFIILEIWMRSHLDSTTDRLAKPSGDWLKELIR